MKRLHKKDMGSMGEACVIAQVIENDCSVFPEFGDNSKIDLIVEDKEKQLHRVQVKTMGRSGKGKEVNNLYLYKSGPNYQYTYSAKDLDWFAVVDFETKRIAWVCFDFLVQNNKTRVLALRHEPPKNGQKDVNMFNDFTEFPFK